jgi:mRNA interferase HicA
VKSSQFIRRARQYAKRHELAFKYDPRRGKGSHGRIYLGEHLTTIKSGNKTLGVGLQHKMLKDLHIDSKEF